MASRPISDDVGSVTPDASAKSAGKKVNEGRGRSRTKQENVGKKEQEKNDEASQVHFQELLYYISSEKCQSWSQLFL